MHSKQVNENTAPVSVLHEEKISNTVPCTAGGERLTTQSSTGKPPIALKPGDRSQQMSRALRFKEENKQHSYALKKATAEAALNSKF